MIGDKYRILDGAVIDAPGLSVGDIVISTENDEWMPQVVKEGETDMDVYGDWFYTDVEITRIDS